MKHVIIIPATIAVAMLAMISCSSSKKTQTDTRTEIAVAPQTIVPDTFVFPSIPEVLTEPSERISFLVSHFWDRFDFSDRDLIQRPEITEQAFVDYINFLLSVPKEEVDRSLLYTLDKASSDTISYRHFASLFEKYYYNPNSPFRNEEYYLPLLQQFIQSPLLPEEAISRYEFQLDMALKNRIGQKSNDFHYTLAFDLTFTLYELQSEYTLLIFTNPGCSTCEAVIKQLNNSKPLNDALAMNSPKRTMLAILNLYPDQDIDAWRANLPNMPTRWINAFDKEMEITRKRLYDIKAIPTIYLLDKEKKVILKDTSIEAVESFFSIKH